MDDQQIQELFSDKEFVDSLLGLETPEEVQETLAEKGLDLTLDEIITIKTSLENDQSFLKKICCALPAVLPAYSHN